MMAADEDTNRLQADRMLGTSNDNDSAQTFGDMPSLNMDFDGSDIAILIWLLFCLRR